MPTLSAITENCNALTMILREKRELRRELVAFFTELEMIWKGLPAELDQTSKLDILNNIVEKGTAEISHGLEVLDRQINSLIEGYGASLQAMKTQFDDFTRLSETLLSENEHIITYQKVSIADLEQNLNKCQADLKMRIEEVGELAETLSKKNNHLADIEKTIENQSASLAKCQSDKYEAIRKNATLIDQIVIARNLGDNCLSEWGMFSDKKAMVLKLVGHLHQISIV